LAEEKLSAQLHDSAQKTIETFRRFSPDPQHAAQEVKAQKEKLASLDPGAGAPERRVWARVLGALTEIDVYLAKHPRLLKLEKIT